ncbi:carboxymuconolactone decarboxylase family protein [Saccharopolyspora indica]|uniref:carboxymuconolactone decarboxylase family protein n=1 Tax=Saccharopolyspora indica TaxID=1229659 RepID=UPI0022EA98DD|nr:carboxymuconolactone decarboxylase family protein [Saccharopolyspora indica]MDA3644794.1 carboxymuconolactone decarboxylase family protein [Saccharopolyspora indica]
MARLDLGKTAPEPYAGFKQADAALRQGPLDATLRELVKIRVSQINGCVYCVDMHSREALRHGEGQDRLLQLPVWQESELFDERERAALTYAEAATRREHVTDELWDALRKAFPDEAELGHLVAQVSLINALNLIGVPLEMKPPRR